MSFEARIEDCETLPRSAEWYAQYPFNPALVAFRDAGGKGFSHMYSPLDEVYDAEPGGDILVGAIPPEEREVRDYLVVAVALRERVTFFEFWWSQFVGQTESYKASLEALRKLNDLCARTREHRAAFCRLSNSIVLHKGLRNELKRIVAHCDAGK